MQQQQQQSCTNLPRSSANVSMLTAGLSLTEPPGLRNSHLPQMEQLASLEAAFNLRRGVLPTAWRKPS